MGRRRENGCPQVAPDTADESTLTPQGKWPCDVKLSSEEYKK